MNTRRVRLFAFTWILAALVAPILRAASPALPLAPAAHFNDYARFVPSDRARTLDARLAQFERDSSNQLLVVIYPKLPEGAALEDYTVRAAQSWGVGQKKKDNGAVLFVFVEDRALRIEVGYGLEGVLTDAVSHAIIENELKPRLRAGDPASALEAAVNAMIAATTGEYHGTGRTNAEQTSASRVDKGGIFMGVFWVVLILVVIFKHIRRGYIYHNPSRRRSWDDYFDNDNSNS
ncbi:MAG TPA: TPM domain-containing protein, partial [Rariglobus sp.]